MALEELTKAINRLAAAVERIAIVDAPPDEPCAHENRTPLPGVMGQPPKEQCDDCGEIFEA